MPDLTTPPIKPFVRAAIIAAVLCAGVPLAAGAPDPAFASDPAQPAGTGAPAQPAALVAFDIRRFFTRAMQLGLTTQELHYSVTIGTDGRPEDCRFARPFRSAFVTSEMCAQLQRVATFRPALDAAGHPVASRYSGSVTILSVFTPDR